MCCDLYVLCFIDIYNTVGKAYYTVGMNAETHITIAGDGICTLMMMMKMANMCMQIQRYTTCAKFCIFHKNIHYIFQKLHYAFNECICFLLFFLGHV